MNNKPNLYVIAGCNGAGKSSFSQAVVNDKIIPFDYDKQYLDVVHLLDSSKYAAIPEHLISLTDGKIAAFNKFPKFLESLLPQIYLTVNKDIDTSEK